MANDKQVNPLVVNSRIEELSKVVNPYTAGLRTDIDSTMKKEPSSEMQKCDLTWSILSTAVDYTINDKDSPYKEVNHSPIYSRFECAQDLVIDEQSDLWDERFEEVSCNLYSSHKFDDTNDVCTTYLGYYKSKCEDRTFSVENRS